MIHVGDVAGFLEQFAPLDLAAEWDNVGLLVGDPNWPAERVMTCLTITPPVVEEAVSAGVQMVVSHHPLPFRPLRRLTTESTPSRMLLQLAAARTAVYSPHTALDSAAGGINQQLAEALELEAIAPLVAEPEEPLGTGRWGRRAPIRLGALLGRVKQFLGLSQMQYVGSLDRTVQTVAVACGAAGELVARAVELGCDAMLLGEARFHTCLEAQANDLALLLPGHFASERFAVERLARRLSEQFPQATVWASRRESDPLQWA